MSATAYSKIDSDLSINEGREAHGFGTQDAKGRKIGANVNFATYTLVEAPDARGGYCKAPGTYYCFAVQATRDGNAYGAGQPLVWCTTEEERAKKVAAYLVGAYKRSIKKAA